MLTKNDIKRILSDALRAELARTRQDALSVFEHDNPAALFNALTVAQRSRFEEVAGDMFNQPAKHFSSLENMVNYYYAAFLYYGLINFLTSGTTGAYKKCPHTITMMDEEANGVKAEFAGVKRIVSLVPAHHLYGFTFTVMLPHVLGVETVALPPLPTANWQELLQPGDLVVGFPLFWQYWAENGKEFPPEIHALCATSPLADELIARLYELKLARFTEIYGASETGAIARRHHANESFEGFDFWEIDPNDQIRLKRKSGSRWQVLPDQAEMESPRRLRPLGRTDYCVQVAGINVYPAHVEEVLSKHPAVKACKVRLMRPEEGFRLKAFIVLNDGYNESHLGIIRTYLSQKLTVHEMPRSFTFGPQLSVNNLGKAQDW